MSESIEKNLKTIYQRIQEACQRVGRDPNEVTLLPVTKTKRASQVRQAFMAGLDRFGENKVQEAQQKAQETEDLPICWCLIGHLQTNKVKYITQFAKEVHSLDRLKLARELDKRLQKQGRGMEVLVQVNTCGEPQKYGLQPNEVPQFLRELAAFSSLRVKGLMTLAVFSRDETLVRPCFTKLRNLRDRLRQEAPAEINLDVLSMGMSGDFEIAIEEGATEVRVGQAIFGSRSLPDSHYWPS